MKKRIILYLILLLFVFPFCSADESWIYQSEKMVIDLSISSNIRIIPESPSYYVDYIKAKISFFPEGGFQQKLLSFETTPDSMKKEGFMEFYWKEPYDEKLEFSLEYTIETENKILEIREKVDFPIKNLDQEIIEYTKPSENFDINNEMIMTASEIAQGEDDLYVVVHKIASWVSENVEYDLKYGETTEKSSWVLKNKKGTCDEISSLFISLCRAVKIPARYVSGVAYSNLPELEGFGNHAWAEVYFPNYGWVPFDVTYKEFGMINPTHLKMKSSFDSRNSSTSYEWRGRNFQIQAETLDINTKIVDYYGKKHPAISIKTKIFEDNIGFGSYNIIEASIENSKGYYVPARIFLSAPNEIYVEQEKSMSLVLKPYETKKVYWVFKLTDDLKRNYVYTIPLSVYDSMNSSSTSRFSSKSNNLIISKKEIQDVLESMMEEDEKIYSRNIEISCSVDKEEYYSDEKRKITCDLKNSGNVILENMNICADENCKIVNMGIAQEKEVVFLDDVSGIGKQQAKISAKSIDVSKTEYLSYDVLDYPKIKITNITYPDNIKYKEDYEISFFINKTSYSTPKDVKIQLIQNSFSNNWMIGEMKEGQIININLNSKTLRQGENSFNIIASFKDNKGNTYKEESNFSIDLEKLTFIEKIESFFYSLEIWLENLINK